MSEFDQALAQAVEDGVARGRLPGAADAMRRGRRRSLRSRGGVAMLGVAALGGAAGVTVSLGGARGGAGPAAVRATTAATTPAAGRSAGAPTSAAPTAHGDGELAVDKWPGNAVVHWVPGPQRVDQGPATAHPLNQDCRSSQGPAFAVTGAVEWGDTAAEPDVHALETVFTFADEQTATAFVAANRDNGSGPLCPANVPDPPVPSPGAETPYGVSWLQATKHSDVGNRPVVEHTWLAQSGNRVAALKVTQSGGTDFLGVEGDAKVLADLRQALER